MYHEDPSQWEKDVKHGKGGFSEEEQTELVQKHAMLMAERKALSNVAHVVGDRKRKRDNDESNTGENKKKIKSQGGPSKLQKQVNRLIDEEPQFNIKASAYGKYGRRRQIDRATLKMLKERTAKRKYNFRLLRQVQIEKRRIITQRTKATAEAKKRLRAREKAKYLITPEPISVK